MSFNEAHPGLGMTFHSSSAGIPSVPPRKRPHALSLRQPDGAGNTRSPFMPSLQDPLELQDGVAGLSGPDEAVTSEKWTMTL